MIVSTAVGMQNAMFSTFSGAVVRTSHLTGLINDAGKLDFFVEKKKQLNLFRNHKLAMIVGQYVRYKLFVKKRKSPELWRLLVSQ